MNSVLLGNCEAKSLGMVAVAVFLICDTWVSSVEGNIRLYWSAYGQKCKWALSRSRGQSGRGGIGLQARCFVALLQAGATAVRVRARPFSVLTVRSPQIDIVEHDIVAGDVLVTSNADDRAAATFGFTAPVLRFILVMISRREK